MASDEQHKSNAALQQLRGRLLDLTARNKLLNFRHTKKSCLRITDELPDQLLDVLLDNRELRFDPVPLPEHKQLIEFGYLEVDEQTKEETQVKNKPSASEWAEFLGIPSHCELPESETVVAQVGESGNPAENDDLPTRYSDSSIQTLLFPEDLESCLRNLQRKTDLAVQEMGTNILFLAFGFLEWYDSDQAEKGRVAPLFLLPVNIRKDKLNTKSKTFEYLLSYSGEDITPNLSLGEKLKTDFSLALPELPTGDEISVEGYLSEIENMFRVMYPRWKVLRHATLGFFDFTKLLMYLDLDPDRWPDGKPLTNHPVVAQFFGGVASSNVGGGASSEEYEIDKLEDVHANYPLVFDADSSQHSAIVEVMDGKSLVIEGPPGTGKSQSISNLIAASIASGKRVLFVAEKLAALEVVKRRLDSVGLGDFVLELHSHKTQKRQLLDSIEERISKRGTYQDSAEIDGEVARYERLREQLSSYVDLINSDWKDTGLTIFEIFTKATRFREASGALTKSAVADDDSAPSFGELYRPANREAQLSEIEHFTHVFKSTLDQAAAEGVVKSATTIAEHPWYGMQNDALYAHDADKLVDSLQTWQSKIDEVATVTAHIARHIDSTPQKVGVSLDAVRQLPQQLAALQMPGTSINHEALARTVDQNVLATCKSEFALFDNLAQQRRQMLPVVARRLETHDQDEARASEAGDVLSSRINNDLPLARVQELEVVAEQIENRLDKVNNALARSVAGLPSGIQTRLYDGTENALLNSQRFLGSVEALGPGLTGIRLRLKNIGRLKTSVFNLEKDVKEVHRLHEKVGQVLNTRRLGDRAKLKTLLVAHDEGGALGWFSSDWRQNKKRLQKLAANENVSVDEVVAALPEGIAFSKQVDALEDNSEYQDAFGSDYQGANTDVKALKELAEWHDSLESQWHTLSDSNQWIDSLTEMSGATEDQLRSMVERGALESLGNIEKDLEDVRAALRARDPIHSPQTALVGDSGALAVLRSQLNETVELLAGYFENSRISVGDVVEQLTISRKYRADQEQWRSVVSSQSLLADIFQIDIEQTQVNDEDYTQISSTLAFSDHLQETVSNDALSRYIAQNPTNETITDLNAFSKQIDTAVTNEQNAFADFKNTGKVDVDRWQQVCGTSFAELESRNYGAIDQKGLLSGWLDYQRAVKSMKQNGLGLLVTESETGNISAANFRQAWKGKIYEDLAREVLSEQPDLAVFSGNSHRALQEQFCECDKRLLELQRIRLASRVDQNAVTVGESGAFVGDLTELKLLQHEVGKKRRHIPIRQLVARASQALVELKPCFMMGPLSAAQYLKPGQLEFDLVVMDEASQIKPEDALGVIARGRQLVVVGDPKQLPPTNFFNKSIEDEEEESAVVSEQESILDATVPMFKTRRLRWHYRSRHEKLIAFSNYHFYDNNLVVFPSPSRASEDLGIKYEKVDGIFENRTNVVEAQRIAELVRSHYANYPSDSIGVVAMNTNQRELIDATIESLSREDALLLNGIEKSQQSNEPLFVKNLENVQGDERDVIVISMTYGPAEKNTRVMQRFGPINSADGWRRLNVLLTRSRKRMVVYSSMSSGDVVVSPTSSRGVHALRDLLAYLETDTLHKTRHTGKEPDSDFEIDVINRLEKRGYRCEPQIGVAGFFIDLAVIDPDSPGKFIVGVECDGAAYHSARSARDRDRLRESVLVGLGWEIRRIWSTDYFKDPDGQINKIVRSIERIRSKHASQEADKNQTEIPVIDVVDEGSNEDLVEADSTNLPIGGLAETSIEEPPQLQTPKSLEEKLELELGELALKLSNGSEIQMSERLLRPDMIRALVEYKPVSVDEYKALLPSFLRRSVHQKEVGSVSEVVELIKKISDNY